MKKLNNNYKPTIGMVHGVFDVVHIGHIMHFEEAKKKVDYLIASVTSDKYVNKAPGKPIFNQNNRINFLKSLKFFNKVILSDHPTAINSIKTYKPDIYFKGKDYLLNKDVTNNLKKEIVILKKNKGKIVFTDSPLHSSSQIINNHFNFLKEDLRSIIKKIDIKSFKKKLSKINIIKKKILIIGDPIIDTYKYVATSGKANKSSVISTQYLNHKSYGGGTILVTKILSHFFSQISSLNILDKVSKLKLLKFLPKKVNFKCLDHNNKIIEKIRFIEKYSNQKLFQSTLHENHEIKPQDTIKFAKKIEAIIKKNDYVFFFDYGYIYKNILSTKFQKKYKSKLIINCQSNSYNFGFNLASKYNSALIMCMDEAELRLTFQNKFESVSDILKKNTKYFTNIKYLIVTCGKNGCYAVHKKKLFFVPTVFYNIQDATGCGDIFLSVFGTLEINTEFNIIEKLLISHIAAGMHGSVFGNDNLINLEVIKKVTDNVIK